jgi:putative salt-induced outer membrane protein
MRVRIPMPAVAAACLVAGTAQAALAAAPELKPDGQWRGSGGAALAAASGNTRSSSLQLDAEARRATAADRILLSAKLHRASSRQQGTRTTAANKWSTSGEYGYKLTDRSYVFGKLGLESDKLIDLSRRRSLAAGVGYELVRRPDTSLEFFGGAGHVADRYGSPQTIDGRTTTQHSRASLYVGEASTHKLTASTTARQRLELYPAVSGDGSLLAKFSAGLAVAMSRQLSLSVGLDVGYNSRPAQGVRSSDASLFTGINFKFGAE